MNKLRIVIFTLVILSASNLLAHPVSAQFTGDPLKQACSEGAGTSSKNPACKQSAGQGTTDPIVGSNGVITFAANIIAVIAGIGAVIMVVIGGIKITTSGGNPQKAAAGRSNVISGLIGVAVVALAWLIVSMAIKLIS